MVGGKTLSDAWFTVKDKGRIIGVNDVPEGRRPSEEGPKDTTSHFFIMEALGWQLKEITELIEKGELRPIVDSVWEMEGFEDAFAKVKSGHSRGKVVIKI